MHSSNMLNIAEYIPCFAELNISHVTITGNAVDAGIGAEIYQWIHFEGKTLFGNRRSGSSVTNTDRSNNG